MVQVPEIVNIAMRLTDCQTSSKMCKCCNDGIIPCPQMCEYSHNHHYALKGEALVARSGLSIRIQKSLE
jgi:hypothetical protein